MKVAIMQPYLFPYIGYFQLIGAVDQFVIHDDVQWIKGGWINRNRWLINGDVQYFTFPIAKASSLLPINSRTWADSFDREKKRFLGRLSSSYRKSANFPEAFRLIEQCVNCQQEGVSRYIQCTLEIICRYLCCETPILVSSELDKNNALKGADRVINIVKTLGGDIYINPIGGVQLYDKDDFAVKGVGLTFLQSTARNYAQLMSAEFHDNLSIVDVLMSNSQEAVIEMMNQYTLT